MTVPLVLDGAVAVVTGAGSGIGRASALSMAHRGARVAVTDLSAERVTEAVAELSGLGLSAFGMPVDVSKESDLVAVRDECIDRFGRIDVVMNNVGVLAVGAPESMPDDAWRHVFEINLMSVARSNRVFLPVLLDQRRGHVVNTASASGLLAYGFDRLPYVAMKHAIVGVSESLAIYLGPRGIGVTCLCPSGVITNILEGITMYGESGATPRAPTHDVVEAGEVGELVADAIEQGTFLVVTVPGVRDELRERAADIETYLARRVEEQLP